MRRRAAQHIVAPAAVKAPESVPEGKSVAGGLARGWCGAESHLTRAGGHHLAAGAPGEALAELIERIGDLDCAWGVSDGN